MKTPPRPQTGQSGLHATGLILRAIAHDFGHLASEFGAWFARKAEPALPYLVLIVACAVVVSACLLLGMMFAAKF